MARRPEVFGKGGRRGRRHDPGEIRRWLERRDREGLTFIRLSEVSGIPAPTLAWWSYRLREKKSSPTTSPPIGFVEVDVTETEQESDLAHCREIAEDSIIELRLRSGRTVRVGKSFHPPTLLRLLKLLGE